MTARERTLILRGLLALGWRIARRSPALTAAWRELVAQARRLREREAA